MNLFFVLLFLFVSTFVWADDSISLVPCAEDQLNKINFQIAKVKSSIQRTYFYDENFGNDKTCPKSMSYCPTKRYVIAENEVLIGKSKGGWVCAFFPNKHYGTTGWLQKVALDFQPKIDMSAPLQSWVGHWKFSQNTIDISKDKDRLHVDGEALWFGAITQDGYRNVHEGSLSGDIKPLNNQADIQDNGCVAQLVLLGRYLIVSDNSQCGGMNVRFDGIYLRH